MASSRKASDDPQIECLTGELKLSPLFVAGIDMFTNTPCDTLLELDTGWKEIYKAMTSFNSTKRTKLFDAKIAIDEFFSAKRLVSLVGRTFPDLKILFIDRRDRVAKSVCGRMHSSQVYIVPQKIFITIGLLR